MVKTNWSYWMVYKFCLKLDRTWKFVIFRIWCFGIFKCRQNRNTFNGIFVYDWIVVMSWDFVCQILFLYVNINYWDLLQCDINQLMFVQLRYCEIWINISSGKLIAILWLGMWYCECCVIQFTSCKVLGSFIRKQKLLILAQ